LIVFCELKTGISWDLFSLLHARDDFFTTFNTFHGRKVILPTVC
jgi:hypothetical protein